MEVFIDTEFTTLDSGTNLPELISIGCVTTNGQEFYAELSDSWQLKNCSQFVVDSVLPLLEGAEYQMMQTQCAFHLKNWFEKLIAPSITLRSDAPDYDWPLLRGLLEDNGCWPNNLHRECQNISFPSPIKQQRFDSALNKYWQSNQPRRHHALIDARGLAKAWSMAMRRGF